MAERGGRRSGAGRKPGASNKRTKEAHAKAKKLGKLPLDVMLEAMHAAYEEGGAAAAFPFAKDAAPYLHPKLATTEVKGDGLKPIPTVINVNGIQPKKADGT